MKKKYNLIFGLGPACSCTMSLRKAGLQHLSFPFDWIGPKPGTDEFLHDVLIRARHIADEFSGRWLRAEDFTHFDPPPTHPRDCYFNEGLKLLFIHDFEKGDDFTAKFPAVQKRYTRRIARLLELIRASKRVLLVRVDRPDLEVSTLVEDCKAAVKLLSEKFAPVKFDVLALHCEHGRSYENRLETDHGDGVTTLVFDYDDDRPEIPKYQPNIGLIAQVLASRCTVKDYRTPEERKAKKLKDRQKEYAKFGAKNWFQYWLAKRKMHLVRHFRKDGK